MTLKQVLDLLDHEVWIRVRPHGLIRDKPDILMWSADWIGGSGYPDEVEKYLECEADDLSVGIYPDPDPNGGIVPMLVVYAYMFTESDLVVDDERTNAKEANYEDDDHRNHGVVQ